MKAILNRKWCWILLACVPLIITSLASCTPKKQEKCIEQQRQEALRKAQEDKARYATAKAYNEDKEKENIQEAKAQKEDNVKEWLQGTWEWSGRIHVYGSMYENVSCRLVVDGDYITFYGNRGVMDQGNIKDIDLDDGVISFGSESRIDFNYNQRYLFYSKEDGECFKKVSSSSSSESYASGTGTSNSSERDALIKKLDKANQEYFSVMGEYQSATDPMWKMQRLQRLKSVNGNCIHYARQLGDKNLLEGFLERDKSLDREWNIQFR